MTKQPDIYYFDPIDEKFKPQPVIVVNLHQALVFFILGWVVSAILSTLLFITLVD